MRQQAPLTEQVAAGIDHVHNSRWETLLSVDDYMGQIVQMLAAAGQLNNTYILFTSDQYMTITMRSWLTLYCAVGFN